MPQSIYGQSICTTIFTTQNAPRPAPSPLIFTVNTRYATAAVIFPSAERPAMHYNDEFKPDTLQNAATVGEARRGDSSGGADPDVTLTLTLSCRQGFERVLHL